MSYINFDLTKVTERYKEIPFIISEKGTLTYDTFSDHVAQTTTWFEESGLGPGERVIIAHEPDMTFIVTFFAVINTGAIAVPVNQKLPPKILRQMITGINGSIIITSKYFFQKLDAPKIIFIDYDQLPRGSVEEIDLIDAFNSVPLSQEASIVFTSGSSSHPRAVLHTLANHFYSALGANQNISLGSGDKWLLSLPLYHVGGLAILFRTLISGASIVLPVTGISMGENIEKFNITHLSMVSTQLYRLINKPLPPDKISRIKAVLLGGGPVTNKLIDQALALGLPVFTSYGSTEMASQITTTRPGDLPSRLYTSGKLLNYRELRINAGGEIEVRGLTLFKGYVEGAEIRKPGVSENWFLTGDMGELDSDGYLLITGRKDNMYISGGENIYPEEIERALLQLRIINQALVVALPQPEYGMQTVAFVKMETGAALDEAQIRSELQKILPGYKIPGIYMIWPEILDSGLKPVRARFAEYAARQLESE